jgi:hypothetical protein
MTTNLHDKMLAAIDAYFSASNEIEAHIAEEQLLDVRAEIRKQKDVPETNFGNMAEPKIGCVNHDCDQCKAVQEPVAWMDVDENGAMSSLRYWSEPDNRHEVALYTTPPAPQPVPVKTYHDGKPWPVAPKPWVGLSEKDVEAYDSWADFQVGCGRQTLFDMVRDIETKLRSKNEY